MKKIRGQLFDRKFNRLLVLSFSYVGADNKSYWNCICDCGNEKVVQGYRLTSGHTKSCGCLDKEKAAQRQFKHGLSKTPEYFAFHSRKRRERKRLLESEWSFEMEVSLQELQTSCALCSSKENLCIDHVQPLSKGYGLRPGNAVILCSSCNLHKHNKELHELPIEIQSKLIAAAEEFRIWWEKHGNTYVLQPF